MTSLGSVCVHGLSDLVLDGRLGWGSGVGADNDSDIGILLVFGQCGGLCKRLESVVVVFCPVSPAT